MRDWIAGAMTVLGTLLVLSGAAIIILRAWGERTETPAPASSTVDRQAVDPLAVDPLATVTTTAPPTATPLPERGARALHRLGPPDRLILWGILLLVLAAIAAGAIGFELGASATAK
jgi:hypothetical protein